MIASIARWLLEFSDIPRSPELSVFRHLTALGADVNRTIFRIIGSYFKLPADPRMAGAAYAPVSIPMAPATEVLALNFDTCSSESFGVRRAG
jgi:hypothetical protein